MSIYLYIYNIHMHLDTGCMRMNQPLMWPEGAVDPLGKVDRLSVPSTYEFHCLIYLIRADQLPSFNA